MKSRTAIADIRREYTGEELDKANLPDDPFLQFNRWFADAGEKEGSDVNGMTLATATPEGVPSARIVLLKGVDTGFLFFTNYDSRKGEELEKNPHAALVFWWPSLNRQVRIEGKVEQISSEESNDYFNSRPRGSRIGAIASPQSQVIDSREFLEERVAEVGKTYSEEEQMPRPTQWGGYRLLPEKIEFWQGRESRLHDRIRYRIEGEKWVKERLAP